MLFDPTPSLVATALFAAGWLAGWALLWRLRPVPSVARNANSRRPVAVVIPARNEAGAIGPLVAALVGQRRVGDEIVVVDDHSTDDTAALAVAAGATVITAPELPTGWAGKPHACWVGAEATVAPLLVFIDADVTPAPDLLDRLVAIADSTSDRILVSVQPWHATGAGWYEQLSWPFNVTSLMGSMGFTVFGQGVARRSLLAFGPVLAVRRAAYVAVGGHGHPTVRGAVTEDIALARRIGCVALTTGSPDTTFRMYPGGPRSLIEGWTKNIAAGARSTPVWFAAMIAAWMWSLAGGWLASPWFYAASVAQVLVQARRVGRFTVLSAVLYPIGVGFFVVIFVRSMVLAALRRPVRWKGRKVASRS